MGDWKIDVLKGDSKEAVTIRLVNNRRPMAQRIAQWIQLALLYRKQVVEKLKTILSSKPPILEPNVFLLAGKTLFSLWQRANPYRHYQPWHSNNPLLKPVLWQYFRWQNKVQLNKMGVTSVVVASEGQLACVKNPKQPTVIICNHIGFADPHALLEPLFDAHINTRWMAGVEPFESPVKAFHLTGNGSFSIDRGLLDRPALQYAQEVLKKHTHALVIFPEGEAHYHTNHIQPFQDGAAALLRKALQTSPTVAWLPIHLTYRWHNPSNACIGATLSQSLHKLYEELYKRSGKGISLQKMAFNLTSPEPFASHVESLCQAVFQWLIQHSQLAAIDATAPWQVLAEQWLIATVQNLCEEHQITTDISTTLQNPLTSDPLALMAIKNQLRSMIVRKARAMPPALWEQWHQQLLRWEKKPRTQPPQTQPWRKFSLGVAEWLLTGVSQATMPWEKRLSLLRRHLNSQKPDREVTVSQRQRWENQLNTCRQLKLVQLLLLQATQRTTPCWEDLEATLQQLWLLVTNKQRYHGPKYAVITVGELQHMDSSNNKPTPTTSELTEQFKKAIKDLSQQEAL